MSIKREVRQVLRICLVLQFLIVSIVPSVGFAQSSVNLPLIPFKTSLNTSVAPVLKGLSFNPHRPMEFEFIFDSGTQSTVTYIEARKLIEYFLTAMTIPNEDLWVNFSPHDPERIMVQDLSITVLGKQLLEQDFMLKKKSSELLDPSHSLGKKFWQKAHSDLDLGHVEEMSSRVWIVPSNAHLHATEHSAIIVQQDLDVLLEEEYVQRESEKLKDASKDKTIENNRIAALQKELLLPELKRLINSDASFAQLRQLYSAVILAQWFKQYVRGHWINRVYANHHKIDGVKIENSNFKQIIYEQYLKSAKEGEFNFIKEEYDPIAQAFFPRQYFSGGIELMNAATISQKRFSLAQIKESFRGVLRRFTVVFAPIVAAGIMGVSSPAFAEGSIEGTPPQAQQSEIITISDSIVSIGDSINNEDTEILEEMISRLSKRDEKNYKEKYPESNPDFDWYLRVSKRELQEKKMGRGLESLIVLFENKNELEVTGDLGPIVRNKILGNNSNNIISEPLRDIIPALKVLEQEFEPNVSIETDLDHDGHDQKDPDHYEHKPHVDEEAASKGHEHDSDHALNIVEGGVEFGANVTPNGVQNDLLVGGTVKLGKGFSLVGGALVEANKGEHAHGDAEHHEETRHEDGHEDEHEEEAHEGDHNEYHLEDDYQEWEIESLLGAQLRYELDLPLLESVGVGGVVNPQDGTYAYTVDVKSDTIKQGRWTIDGEGKLWVTNVNGKYTPVTRVSLGTQYWFNDSFQTSLKPVLLTLPDEIKWGIAVGATYKGVTAAYERVPVIEEHAIAHLTDTEDILFKDRFLLQIPLGEFIDDVPVLRNLTVTPYVGREENGQFGDFVGGQFSFNFGHPPRGIHEHGVLAHSHEHSEKTQESLHAGHEQEDLDHLIKSIHLSRETVVSSVAGAGPPDPDDCLGVDACLAWVEPLTQVAQVSEFFGQPTWSQKKEIWIFPFWYNYSVDFIRAEDPLSALEKMEERLQSLPRGHREVWKKLEELDRVRSRLEDWQSQNLHADSAMTSLEDQRDVGGIDLELKFNSNQEETGQDIDIPMIDSFDVPFSPDQIKGLQFHFIPNMPVSGGLQYLSELYEQDDKEEIRI